jgi:hypothetical protein
MVRHRLFLALTLVIFAIPTFGTSVSAATAPVAGCSTNQVALLASGWFGAAGSGGMVFDVVNRGARCRIGGYPSVTFLDKSALAVDNHDIHSSSMFFTEPRAVAVTLSRGGVATFGVSWNDNPIGKQACPITARALVVLSHGVGNLWGEVPVNSEPCGRTLWVTPIESGTWPRLNG